MPARTRDDQDAQPVICCRRADYTLRLILHSLCVFSTGVLFYPFAGSDLVPEITWHRPVWWASEARRGWQLLDAARQPGSGFPELARELQIYVCKPVLANVRLQLWKATPMSRHGGYSTRKRCGS